MALKFKAVHNKENLLERKLFKKKYEENTILETKYNSLDEVIDYNHPFSIFYSGVENEKWFEWVYEMGVRNFLMSYEYIKGKSAKIMRRFKEYNDVRLFIDSGAFTIFNNPDFADYTNAQWEKRIVEYLKWCRKHKDMIFAVADLDLQEYVGVPIVTEWRKKYFEPFMLETGIPVCFVWHPIDGDAGWERMCQRYPYVSTSLVSDDLSGDNIAYKLKIAEKHNAVVQGMGSTRTSVLPNLPFFSVDSTTYLTGLQYGEMNFWDVAKNKMKRLKKDQWQGEYLEAVLNATGLDREKLLEEDKEQMIKANVYAFIQAEKFIRQMHKKIIYWQKAKAVKITLDSLPPDYLPSPEYLKTEIFGNPDSMFEYAQKMNINKDLDKSELHTAITCMTLFLRWDDKSYREVREKFLEDGTMLEWFHDTFINRIVSTDDEKIKDLREFFIDCLEGRNTKLLYWGTNFDRIAKEREYYIDDTEFEETPVHSSEIYQLLQNNNLLPAPREEGETAPEIDILDDEIFSRVDLRPVRNEKGAIICMHRRTMKPKKLYSDKYPKLACDVCYQAQRCPEYEAGMVCAFNKMFKRYDTRSMADIIQLMQGMVDTNVQRMQRALVMETISGGMIDASVSSLIDQNMRLTNFLKQMYESASAEVIKQTRIINADGTCKEVTSVTNVQQGGVLENLMKQLLNKDELAEEKEPQNDLVVIDLVAE